MVARAWRAMARWDKMEEPQTRLAAATAARYPRRRALGRGGLRMAYVIGFVVWIVIGIVAAVVMRTMYAAVGTATWLTFAFGIFGAFVGGMLATSGYVYHD